MENFCLMVLVVGLDMVVKEGMHITKEITSAVVFHMGMLSFLVHLVVEVEMKVYLLQVLAVALLVRY